MTLDEKIQDIKNPLIKTFNKGYDETIEDFFNNFIKPMLPDQIYIKKWHKILMEYTNEVNISNISCCIRYGNNGSDSLSVFGESGYYKLRRGWQTKNKNDNFKYFFADNFFSSFIYKMALDGFCPNIEEFEDSFRKNKFPYGFGFMVDKKINEYKGVVIQTADEPGFLGKYKLSHVFDSGNNFCVDGTVFTGKDADKRLSNLYFPIGHSDDFLNNKDKIREMEINDLSKKVIIAKFLRFAHPFNYFLTPSPKLHSCTTKVKMNDIGEDERMITYVREYLRKTYPLEYKEFLEKIMWYDEPGQIKPDGKINIGISYNPYINKCSIKPSNKALRVKSKRFKISIVFNPSEEVFKKELLIKRAAEITWIYSDGTKKICSWNAKNINEKSSIRGNIQSRPEWREKKGLISVELKLK